MFTSSSRVAISRYSFASSSTPGWLGNEKQNGCRGGREETKEPGRAVTVRAKLNKMQQVSWKKPKQHKTWEVLM